ncbi:hypothetical protein ALNOE001_13860 [Candidatus Methanobinarius endosymbioticus]|uniref:RDD domain-containing protein n=1 Tax=Candidatus Methanobinarius endosymbioticus TaxID=2006182 RepID=A0A366MBF9_9EURY|nr:hypothetical protein ALNOE001_13860 [Candidatus Methanobinarius endosymbioticus]
MVSIFKKRILAYLADYFIVSAIIWISAQLLYFIILPLSGLFVYECLVILTPIVGIIYFVLLENKWGTTVGKHLLFLEVVSTDDYNYHERIPYKQAIIRNLSKIYWLPIIVDIIIGRLVGSSNERILGRYAKTKVILEEIARNSEEKKMEEVELKENKLEETNLEEVESSKDEL